MTDFGPAPFTLDPSRPSFSISTGQKRTSYTAPLSAQTRSMSRVSTHHNLTLASLAQDHKTAFGGIRRKREPLIDALVAAGSSGSADRSGSGSNEGRSAIGGDADEERPRKMTKVSSFPSKSSHTDVNLKSKIKVKPRATPSQTSTPKKRLNHLFPFQQDLVPGSPSVFLPKPDSPAGSDSSEDSLMLKPTPRKAHLSMPASRAGGGRGTSIGGGEEGRRRLWADGGENTGDNGSAARPNGASGHLKTTGPIDFFAAPIVKPSSSDDQYPKPPATTSQTSSIGPIRHAHSSSHSSVPGLSRPSASYAQPTKASMTASSSSAPQTIGAKARAMAKIGDGSKGLKKTSLPPGMGSASSSMSLARMGNGHATSTGSGSTLASRLSTDGQARSGTGMRKLGPPAAGSLHKRSSTIGGATSSFNLAGIAEDARPKKAEARQQQPAQRDSDSMDVDTVVPATTAVEQSALSLPKTSALPTLSKLPMGVRKPSTLSHPPSFLPPGPPSSSSPNIRRPSYPSSLGSGPLAKPTSRVVSNPVVSKENLRLLSSNAHDVLDGIAPSGHPFRATGMRAVSDPSQVSALARSTSIRNGLGDDAVKGLTGLNAAMAKLQMMKSGGGGTAKPASSASSETGGWEFPKTTSSGGDDNMEVDWQDAQKSAPSSTSSSSYGLSRSTTGLGKSRCSLASSMGPPSAYKPPMSETSSIPGPSIPTGTRRISGSATLRDLMSTAAGGDSLKGVTAFVDVRTSEGDDSSSVFAEMLKACGAKVLARPSESITHVIFKSGAASTLSWWRRQDEPRPHIVGIGWVTRCKELGELVPEGTYAVNVDDQAVFQRRRKSMEPRHLAAVMGGGVPGITLTAPSGPQSALQSIAHARRLSTQFCPKISSPLKKTASRRVRPGSDDED